MAKNIATNAFIAVSMILCMGTGAFWLRSAIAWDYVEYGNDGWAIAGVTSMCGQISFHSSVGFAQEHESGYYWTLYSCPPVIIPGNRLPNIWRPGFEFSSCLAAGIPFRVLSIPDWFLVTLFGLAPSIRLCKFIRRQRWRLSGCCVECGYDLRATPHRCPECGMETGTP